MYPVPHTQTQPIQRHRGHLGHGLNRRCFRRKEPTLFIGKIIDTFTIHIMHLQTKFICPFRAISIENCQISIFKRSLLTNTGWGECRDTSNRKRNIAMPKTLVGTCTSVGYVHMPYRDCQNRYHPFQMDCPIQWKHIPTP